MNSMDPSKIIPASEVPFELLLLLYFTFLIGIIPAALCQKNKYSKGL